MRKVRVEEVKHAGFAGDPSTVRHLISDELGTSDVAIVYYELKPGDSFAGVMHCHHDQEEVFCVLSGTATFETMNGQRTVGAGEVIRFGPGEFQNGHNRSNECVRALVLAAPKSGHDVERMELFTECETCGERTIYEVRSADEMVLRIQCRHCGTEDSL